MFKKSPRKRKNVSQLKKVFKHKIRLKKERSNSINDNAVPNQFKSTL